MSNSEKCDYFRRPLTEKLIKQLEEALNTEPLFTKYEEARLKFEAEYKEFNEFEELSSSEDNETPNDEVTFTDRKDLKTLLEESTEDEDEDDTKFKENRIKFLLKMHKYRKKMLKTRKIPELENYLYYGSGLLMENDKYYSHLKQLQQKCKQKKKRNETLKKKNVNNEKIVLNDNKPCTSTKSVKNGCIDNLSLNVPNNMQSNNYMHCNGYTKSNEIISQLNYKEKNMIDIKNKDNAISTNNNNYNDNNNNSYNQKTCTITSNSNSNINAYKNKITSHLVASKPIVPLSTTVTNISTVSNIKRPKVKRDAEQMTIKRQKVYLSIIKKDVLKLQKSRFNFRKDAINANKKLALACQKHVRQKALQAQRNSKEAINRAKKLNREVQSLWKVQDRADRETEKRLKKEVEEQRRIDNEMLEVRRQQRKLNFLITQTELYAHFISKKFHDFNEEQFEREQQRILNQLDEDVQNANSEIAIKDYYDVNQMKMIAEKNVIEAFRCENERTQYFERCQMFVNDLPRKLFPLQQQSYSILNFNNLSSAITPLTLASSSMSDFITDFFPQPNLFKGVLKCYQLKGVNWLAKLYNQKISGILADEMGLGKTIQSIAFLCHIAENYGVWGPFLIISPASTLHNWQQELEKFAPDFKIVPYWGSPNDRKVLRQFWDARGIQNKLSSFHIVVTSYQIVISDIKYFNKIRWQYMILDEAQAIKSSSSIRWKLLLSFNCRNRLLLSGTPIQNSMAELWALLHFIMPTLFDSHEEFNEWFSKDIENCAENRTGIDERHLSRLHMILKPFMLRRIKKDVENELSDKIEIMLYCPLSMRQNVFYTSLKNKILNEDLLCSFEKNPSDKNVATNLMNFVMQFRKVCNHPDLFEKRVRNGQYFQEVLCYPVPKLIYEFAMDNLSSSISAIFDIYSCLNIYISLFKEFRSTFSFIRFLNLSFEECNRIFNSSLIYRLMNYLKIQDIFCLLRHRHFVWNYTNPNQMFYCILKDLHSNEFNYNIKFYNNEFYKFIKVIKPVSFVSNSCISLPKIFLELTPKIISKNRKLYTYDKRAEIHSNNHLQSDEYMFCLNFTNKIAQWCKMPNLEKETFVSDAGKLTVLDSLLRKLKKEDHRVLIYSQMTKMIDLLEEFMFYRKYKYIRLDGSSKISDRRDMVADFQARSDIFVFLLSTRAGGLGINLTAADTVIFYDSDWNPTVDQQAMDRAHRLGQTKQVTVYRLICKHTIEETILQKATEKNEMQKMVISGGDCKMDFLKSKQVASLLLDDVELEEKCVNLMQSREKNCEKFMKRKCEKNVIESPKTLKKPKITKTSTKNSKDETSPTLTKKIKYKRRHNNRGRPRRATKQIVNKSPKEKDKHSSPDFKYRSPKKSNTLRKGPGRPKVPPKKLTDNMLYYNSEYNNKSSESPKNKPETDSSSIKLNSLGKFNTHLTNIQFSSMKY